jgi:hypothetical protein
MSKGRELSLEFYITPLFNGEPATLITIFSGNSTNLKDKGLEIVGSYRIGG